jgi:adenylate cyclase
MADIEPNDYQISIDRVHQPVRVIVAGQLVAQTTRAIRMRETRLPDCLYIPKEDVEMSRLRPSDQRSFCPFKGTASYWDLVLPDQVMENAAWSYEQPLKEAGEVPGYISFSTHLLDDGTQALAADRAIDRGTLSGPLVNWLLRQAYKFTSPEELVAGMARLLVDDGVPLWRIGVGIWTLHPLLAGRSYTWMRDSDEVVIGETPHGALREPAYMNSPVRYVSEGLGGVRQRLDGTETEFDFPVMAELKASGGTDYVAMPLPFSDGQIQTLTLASDDPSGFTIAHLGPVFECSPVIGRYLEVLTIRNNSRTLLHTYLGPRTGDQVLHGRIRRGDRQDIRAALIYCDLRDSTGWTERLSRDNYLWLLNTFFENAVTPITQQGGEVLKFIGDAVLAIFPCENGDVRQANNKARRAAAAIARAVARMEGPDGRPVECAIGVHFGELSYGNVGSPDRLDFTAIGTAANVVARLSDLGKDIGTPIVISIDAAQTMDGVVSLGHRKLHRVSRPIEVFTLTG